MKKILSLILALITLLALCACGAEKAAETIAITDYNIDGNAEVHSCSCCVLDNGNTQYTLEFTAAAGKSITVFNPPDGSVFQKMPETITTGAKDTLVFELTAAELAAIDEITISFCDDSSCDFVYFWAPK
jgi:hypothetical protein